MRRAERSQPARTGRQAWLLSIVAVALVAAAVASFVSAERPATALALPRAATVAPRPSGIPAGAVAGTFARGSEAGGSTGGAGAGGAGEFTVVTPVHPVEVYDNQSLGGVGNPSPPLPGGVTGESAGRRPPTSPPPGTTTTTAPWGGDTIPDTTDDPPSSATTTVGLEGLIPSGLTVTRPAGT